MNGVWTCELSKLKAPGGIGPEDLIFDGTVSHVRLGDFTDNNAIAFFQRCGELGVNALVIASIPKDVREDFYAGKCVMISLGHQRIAFLNTKLVASNKKKPLTPPTEPC